MIETRRTFLKATGAALAGSSLFDVRTLLAAPPGDTTVRLSQEELAQTLGVTREIVSRQLAIWRDAGVVELGRGWIKVRDGEALDRIVAGG